MSERTYHEHDPRSGEYSVCQFFKNDTWEYVRRWVSAPEAVDAFKHYTTSVAAQVGMTVRVIITDGGDSTNAEWVYGKGIVFPVKNQVENGNG